MDNKYWEIKNVNKDKDGTVISVKLRDLINNSFDATFKWDGCIDLFKYSNGYTPETTIDPEDYDNVVDYIHICDIDETIEQLMELKKIMNEMNIK